MGQRRIRGIGWMSVLAGLAVVAGCSAGPDGDPQTIESPLPSNGGATIPSTTDEGDETPSTPKPPITIDSDAGTTTPPPPTAAAMKKRLTGVNLESGTRWKVGGTNLGIPYVLENGSIGYLFGDTFSTAVPSNGESANWRSLVMLRSATKPGDPDGIIFDSAAKVKGNGLAPALLTSAHDSSGKAGAEWTVLPTDGVSFPETKRQLIAFSSIHTYKKGAGDWQTNYAGLAYSDNGNDFTRVANLTWSNNSDNSDPYQQWTMQRDGDYVYVFSVRAGRQEGPMMLRRVHWEKMFTKSAYECWDATSGSWGSKCTGVIEGRLGDPSVRKLKSGTWAMSYFNVKTLTIVTRTASEPTGPWSEEKIQVTFSQEPNLYGGYIHPWSDVGPDGLHLMVSKFTNTDYHVSQWVGTL